MAKRGPGCGGGDGALSVKRASEPKKHKKTLCLQKAAILLQLLPEIWWDGCLHSHSPPSARQLLFLALAPELTDRQLATDIEMQLTDEISLLCYFSLLLTTGREHAFMSMHCYL